VEGNIKMDFREIGWECRAVVNTGNELSICRKCGQNLE
jgi:hypothetical protein